MAGPNDFDAVVREILKQTGNTNNYGTATVQNPFLSSLNPWPEGPTKDAAIVGMLTGAGLESNWRNVPQAGGGPGYGYWQITNGPHDLPSQVALWWPHYWLAAGNHVTEPEGPTKYGKIAFDAEKPAKMYAAPAVASAYQTVLSNYGGASATGSAGSVQTGGAISGWLAWLGPVLAFLGDLTDIRMWRSLGWIALGALVFILGLIIWLRKPIENAVGAVAKGFL